MTDDHDASAPDDARRKLDDLHGKTLAEAAQTYVFGVLEVDVSGDLQDLWEATFEDEAQRREIAVVLRRLGDADREALLAVAMQATVEDRPETAPLFAEAVEQAGQSLFVVEVAALAAAAAVLLREWHTKGRTRDTRRKTVIEPGRITIEEHSTEFDPNGPLGELLDKLGLGEES